MKRFVCFSFQIFFPRNRVYSQKGMWTKYIHFHWVCDIIIGSEFLKRFSIEMLKYTLMAFIDRRL